MKAAAPKRDPASPYPPGSLRGKLRKRGIIGALAAFAGSGWLIYEIVHFILVDHYHLPEGLKDITIVSVVCATFCALTWRWFRGAERPRKVKWEIILIPAFVLIAAVANVKTLLHLRPGGPSPSAKSGEDITWANAVAVLPFINMSAEREQDYFCDGLTEELITKLSQIRELKVTARTSAFAFKGTNKDVREVGRALGVDKVLEGSVRTDGGKLRIVAQLINTSDGFHIWSRSYDREKDEIIKIQDDIALSVAGALKVTLLGDLGRSEQAVSFEAYDEFLQGRQFYGNPTRQNAENAIEHLERAIRMDPGFARAWSLLAAMQASQASFGYVPVEEGYPKALASVERALALDPRLAHAHAVLGWIQMTYSWDWAGAEASYRQAMELEPGKGILEAAQLALALGHDEQALRLARQAVALDGLNDSANMTLALTAYYSGKLEEAAESFRKALLLRPDRANAHALLGQVALARSDVPEALAEIEREKDVYWRLPSLALAYHAAGRADDSAAALSEFIAKYQDVGAFQVAQVCAFRGETDTAFEWLEKAYAQRDGGLFLTKADPFLRRLKGDVRFGIFLKKMGLPQD
ncbi:MAG TPA: tetratricopeptide repeat protein [Acidobacteriota bacterium]|nr:tetratricopeptide repeat protein [Acidobacteriota bacterium]